MNNKIKILKYMGLTFDEFAQSDTDEQGKPTFWANICPECAKRMGGHGGELHFDSQSICSVQGCTYNGATNEQGTAYLDFDNTAGIEFAEQTREQARRFGTVFADEIADDLTEIPLQKMKMHRYETDKHDLTTGQVQSTAQGKCIGFWYISKCIKCGHEHYSWSETGKQVVCLQVVCLGCGRYTLKSGLYKGDTAKQYAWHEIKNHAYRAGEPNKRMSHWNHISAREYKSILGQAIRGQLGQFRIIHTYDRLSLEIFCECEHMTEQEIEQRGKAE